MSVDQRVRAATAFALSSALVACGAYDASLSSRFTDVNQSIDEARNDVMLLNVLRASDHQPLTFSVFAKASGNLATNYGLAVPTFEFGYDAAKKATVSNNTLGTVTTVASSFEIQPLETDKFYKGLLRPVDAEFFDFFLRQGYERELLFWIFAETVRAKHRGITIEEFPNAPPLNIDMCPPVAGPNDPPACFKDFVDWAVQQGLTTEKVQITKDKTTQTVTRMCFDAGVGEEARLQAGESGFRTWSTGVFRPQCGADEGVQSWPSGFLATKGNVTYEVIPRSAYSIFLFLGKVIAQGATDEILIEDGSQTDARLVAIDSGRRGTCFAEAEYYGKHYCVPHEGAENTKQIFAILTQLIALGTSPEEIRATSTIQLSP